MTEVIVTRGIPGSGKSTWAKAWVAEDPDNRVRVNRDDIRFTSFGKYWGVDEDFVSAVEMAAVKAAIKAGKDVVIDATHLRASYVKKWARIHPVTVKDFDCHVETAVARDATRDRVVGADVIRGLAKRFGIKPNGALPQIDLSDVQPEEGFKPYVPGKIRAFMFDIDGTLAIMKGRSPYDASRYLEDYSDRALAEILWGLQDAAMKYHPDTVFIGLSGRSEDHREVTDQWLREWGLPLDLLFMRPSGDQRNDAIIKSELVDNHISGVYDVVAHFDDRQRVVDALRAKGLKVLQVADGNF